MPVIYNITLNSIICLILENLAQYSVFRTLMYHSRRYLNHQWQSEFNMILITYKPQTYAEQGVANVINISLILVEWTHHFPAKQMPLKQYLRRFLYAMPLYKRLSPGFRGEGCLIIVRELTGELS